MKRRGFLKGLIAAGVVVPAVVVKANRAKVDADIAFDKNLLYWSKKRNRFEKWCRSYEEYMNRTLGPDAYVLVCWDRMQHNTMNFTWDTGPLGFWKSHRVTYPRSTFSIDLTEWCLNNDFQRHMIFKVRYSQARADARRHHNG